MSEGGHEAAMAAEQEARAQTVKRATETIYSPEIERDNALRSGQREFTDEEATALLAAIETTYDAKDLVEDDEHLLPGEARGNNASSMKYLFRDSKTSEKMLDLVAEKRIAGAWEKMKQEAGGDLQNTAWRFGQFLHKTSNLFSTMKDGMMERSPREERKSLTIESEKALIDSKKALDALEKEIVAALTEINDSNLRSKPSLTKYDSYGYDLDDMGFILADTAAQIKVAGGDPEPLLDQARRLFKTRDDKQGRQLFDKKYEEMLTRVVFKGRG